MKFSRYALLSAVAVRSVSAFAFTSRSTSTATSSFLGKRAVSVSGRTPSSPTASRRVAGTTMFFGNLFSSPGAYDEKINYSVLDHPGPELAKFAELKQVPEYSEKDPHLALATFAGGCFWGLELAYQRVPGVVYTATGYTQGPEDFPTYNQVCAGNTGHTEAIIVYYDPKETSYENLLDTFFDRVDPTTVNGQGNDRGKQYRTGVYFHSKEQEEIARQRFEEEKKKYSRPIASELKAATPFWPAEKYHQQYLEKGGRFGTPQDASKGATDTIRCYG